MYMYVFQKYLGCELPACTHTAHPHIIRLSKRWLQRPCRSECCGFVQIEWNMYVWMHLIVVQICDFMQVLMALFHQVRLC